MRELMTKASHDVGIIRVTTVSDGVARFPLPDDFVMNATKLEVPAVLLADGPEADQVELHYNPVVLGMAKGRALVDTGFGEAARQQPGATTGCMQRSMARAGIDSTSIDTIPISYFHPDHVCGLLASTAARRFRTRQSWCRNGNGGFGWMTGG